MALDEDALAAVDLLLANPICRDRLRSRERNRRELGQWLDDRADADRAAYPEIIDEAHCRLLAEGGLAKRGAGDPSHGNNDDGGSFARRPPLDESLIFAPYRFIEIAADVVPPPRADIAHDRAEAGLYSGSIEVEWIAETPLLIGGPSKQDAPDEPLQIGGRHVIPGATIRGLVRTACEIVGQAKLPRGNWHHRYGLRDFDHPYYRGGSGITEVDKVTAGFLTIRPAEEGDPPGIVAVNDEVWEIRFCDWFHVPIETLTAANGLSGVYSKELPLLGKYRCAGMSDGRSAPDFSKTLKYSHLPDDNNRKRRALDGKGGADGVPVFSGKLPGGGNKKFEYVLFRDPAAKPAPVPADIVRNFLRLHSTPNKNKLEPAFSWKDVRAAAYRPAGLPVFAIGSLANGGADFFFGLTRLFKIPHRKSVGDVVLDALPAHRPTGRLGKADSNGRRKLEDYAADMVENLFGYVVEPGDLQFPEEGDSIDPAAVALRGRVAFGFAGLSGETPAKVEEQPVEVIQMAPRASFAPYYLKGAQEKDYSADKVGPAGFKAYFPRYPQPDARKALQAIRDMGKAQIDVVSRGGTKSVAKVTSRLKFLMPKGEAPLSFSGRIRLHNVTPEEIGLLLFAITHGGERNGRRRHMMGRARPFGAGQMRVGRIALDVEANDAGANDGGANEAGGAKAARDLEGFIAAFAAHMRNSGAPQFPDTPGVAEWLGMADPANATGSRLEYQPDVKKFGNVRKFVKPMDPRSGPPAQNRPRLLKTPCGT